jgi:hypothetical protein
MRHHTLEGRYPTLAVRGDASRETIERNDGRVLTVEWPRNVRSSHPPSSRSVPGPSRYAVEHRAERGAPAALESFSQRSFANLNAAPIAGGLSPVPRGPHSITSSERRRMGAHVDVPATSNPRRSGRERRRGFDGPPLRVVHRTLSLGGQREGRLAALARWAAGGRLAAGKGLPMGDATAVGARLPVGGRLRVGTRLAAGARSTAPGRLRVGALLADGEAATVLLAGRARGPIFRFAALSRMS